MSRRPGNPPGGGGSRGWPRPGYPRAAAAAAAVAVAAGVAAFALRRPEPPVGAGSPGGAGAALGEAHAAAVRGWKARWEQDSTGWHLGEVVHPLLLKFKRRALGDPGQRRRVLVPLAGKTFDMVWLATQGHAVVGVEVSPLACERFFADHNLPRDSVSAARGGGGIRRLHRAGLITLVEGDLFALRPERAFAGGDAEVADALAAGAGGGALDVIWDRAAHVAVEPELRQSYVATLDAMLRKGGRVLLVGLDYDDARAKGPPHR